MYSILLTFPHKGNKQSNKYSQVCPCKMSQTYIYNVGSINY